MEIIEIIEIIKSLSILTILEHYHLKPNRNKTVCCTFHNEKKTKYAIVLENKDGVLLLQ